MISLSGQSNQFDSDVDLSLQKIIEDFIEFSEGEADFDFNTLYEELLRFNRNPININKATDNDLSQLVFLTDIEIQNILDYRNKFGDFLSIYELQSVPGLSLDKLSLIRLFVFADSDDTIVTPLTITTLSKSQDQLYVKWKYNIETARGFQSIDGNDPKFGGDKNHYYLRYNHVGDKSRFGLTIEKDPGEKFINSFSETGLDYLSGHIQIENANSYISRINIGDYSVNLGQGLIAHSAFGLGKSSFTTTVKKSRQGVRYFNSVTENQALRGLALEIENERSPVNGLIFVSHTPRDANLIEDEDDLFSSLPMSGLHRTEGERTDQDAVYETSLGGSLGYRIDNVIKINANVIHHYYDKSLSLRGQPYQLFRWQGNLLTNYSIDYDASLKGWNLFGEIAGSSTEGWAQIYGLLKTLDPKFDISIVYRDYAPEYQSIYANAFGENQNANNERGVYLGLEYRPSRNWTIKAYSDQWRNDWLRFRVDGPASGREYLFKLDYREKRRKNYYVQYRYELKDENSAEDLIIDVPVPKSIQRLRFHAVHQLDKGIELRSRIEFSLFKKDGISERGFLAYQDILSRSINSPLSLSTRLSYFNISDFDARIYTYENDLLFEYYIPSFSGEGMRYYIHGRYDFSRKLMAELRWEQTYFFGEESVRSGNELIDGNTLSRVKLQLRYNF